MPSVCTVAHTLPLLCVHACVSHKRQWCTPSRYRVTLLVFRRFLSFFFFLFPFFFCVIQHEHTFAPIWSSYHSNGKLGWIISEPFGDGSFLLVRSNFSYVERLTFLSYFFSWVAEIVERQLQSSITCKADYSLPNHRNFLVVDAISFCVCAQYSTWMKY